MSRYDQVEPHVGIVRVPLAANLTIPSSGEFGPVGVSINANGRLEAGTAAQSGLIGVLVKNCPTLPASIATAGQVINNWMGARAGDVVDVMSRGQILDTGLPAGSKIYAAADGSLSTTVRAGFQVGYTVEAGRLVVELGLG